MKRTLRRLGAVAGAALVGLTATFALASPASAHDSSVTPTTECDRATGEWIVTWTVGNDFKTEGTISAVKATPTDVTFDKLVIPVPTGNANGYVSGTQRVPGDTKKATLSLTVTWPDGYHVSFPGGTKKNPHALPTVTFKDVCKKKPVPPTCLKASRAHFSHTFDGPKGLATVSLKGDLPLCDGEKQPFTLVSFVSPGDSPDDASFVFDVDSKLIDPTHKTISLAVKVPACNVEVLLISATLDTAPDLTVASAQGNDTKVSVPLAKKGGTDKDKLPYLLDHYSGPAVDCAAVPTVNALPACDGSVGLTLMNGESATLDATFVVTAAGGFSETVTLKAGEVKVVTIPAAKATGIVAGVKSSDGKSTKELFKGDWTAPKNCAAPTVAGTSDCKNLTVTVTNPVGGLPSVTATIEYGDKKSEVVKLAAGEKKDVVIAGTAGLTATVTIDEKVTNVAYAPDASCTATKPGGGDLPVTGASIGIAAGVAAALLAVGGFLFVAARRRRTTFTA
ncbi:hypothetical protein Lfu02_50400 [Longispora fulva]|uniref:LPXTG-motif cell wall-anchored protein n=1 Tax=Longispora fulva TaxID=619741 RepID=A0A8J7KZH8_9ACTN|nr:hypothetical protein [Longispora fulva]MBG6141062.1 hypothetical protein [Longispora fulva]GIG60668.1 hypothetical protein Lfu02_50400 [Longispora fulva]